MTPDAPPAIGITMGDPSGVGPEILLKALDDPEIMGLCRPLILGDRAILERARDLLGCPLALHEVATPWEGDETPPGLPLLPLSGLDPRTVLPGRPSLEGGRAMVACIRKAVDLAMEGRLDAFVTCPISKALMQAAGFPYDGHTELVAERTGTRDVVMMLAGERLRVALVTIHCALREVPGRLTVQRILTTLRITGRALVEDLGIPRPRIAVCGLNPHAGEGGLFGGEEEETILPALRAAEQEGIRVSGPFPPDTLFWRAVRGEFDTVVAMYHDQGLIPLKLLHFSDAVNVTLGLPILRTSVDHGTAYDLAGTGRADPDSLKAAIRMAAAMARHRAAFRERNRVRHGA